MENSKPIMTPIGATTTLDSDEDDEPVDYKEYISMTGSLLYLPLQGQTYNLLYACVHDFKLLHVLHINKLSNRF